jgi:hypothetical protein
VRALVFVAACSGAAGPPPVKEAQLNATGAMVDVKAALVPGYVTIVDFWSESCAACTEVAAKVDVGIANQPKVIVRKIDVGDGFTAVAHAYDINALPHYNVYDPKQRLRYVLVGSDCLRAPDLARELLAEP